MKKKIAEIVKSLKDITGNVALSYEDQQRIDEIIEELESIEPQRVLISKELTAEQRFSSRQSPLKKAGRITGMSFIPCF